MKQSPSSGGMKQSPSFGGMTTQDTAITVEIRDYAYWPDEAQLADFAQKDNRVEPTDRLLEDSTAYATLYFVS